MLLCSFLYLHICSSCYSFFSKRHRRKETEYAAMHTFARFCCSSANASARTYTQKGEKNEKKARGDEEDEVEGEKARYLRGRPVSIIYENKSIETRSLCVVMLLLYVEKNERKKRKRRRRRRRKRKKRRGKWQCSLLV